MINPISPCLAFGAPLKTVATFYCSLFEQSTIGVETPMVIQFDLAGQKIKALYVGEAFKITPAISFMVYCQSDAEITRLAEQLAEGGSLMMALGKYPWAEKYAWVKDQFGMTWQLMLADLPSNGQKIVPSFLFVGEQFGHAQAAMTQYTQIFEPAQIVDTQLYAQGEPAGAGKLKFGQFALDTMLFNAMDGAGNHAFGFSEGISLVVECDTQQEIDHYWTHLGEGGTASSCGWLKDRFGVSWQILPKNLGALMTDPQKGEKAMQALLKMKKIVVNDLMNL